MMALSRSTAHLARRGVCLTTRFASGAAKATQEADELRLLEQYAKFASALDAPLTHSTEQGKHRPTIAWDDCAMILCLRLHCARIAVRTLVQQVKASVVATDAPEVRICLTNT